MTDPGDEHSDENLVTRLRSLKLDAADEAVREIMRLQSLMPAHIERILYEGSG
jgi:hypothetical protein